MVWDASDSVDLVANYVAHFWKGFMRVCFVHTTVVQYIREDLPITIFRKTMIFLFCFKSKHSIKQPS